MTSTLTHPQSTASEVGAALDFEALYRDTRDDIYAYVATLLRDRAAAEDVTAPAFERAYRKARTLRRRAAAAPRAWLFGIARNAALDELRRRKRTRDARGRARPTSPAAPDEAAEPALDRAAVRAALGGLAPRDRELIALRFHAGLDNAEVADVLGTSDSNAGTQLHRAMTKLREAVDDAPDTLKPSSTT